MLALTRLTVFPRLLIRSASCITYSPSSTLPPDLVNIDETTVVENRDEVHGGMLEEEEVKHDEGSLAGDNAVRQKEQMLDGQSQHALSLNPKVYNLMKDTRTFVGLARKNKHLAHQDLWKHVQGYAKSAYAEKSLLLDPELSAAIASAIAARSERDPEGAVFMDADAGCLDVTRVLLERGVFARAQVLVRDAKLRPLHEWALKETLYHVADRVDFKNVNLLHVMQDSLASRGANLSPLCDGRSDDWCRPAPPYTLYANAPASLFKYLTGRSLRRDSFLSEFYRGRPEFFFVVTHKTLRDLTATNRRNNRLLPINALFQILFDYELLLTLPRSSYFPWKKTIGRVDKESKELSSSSSDANKNFYLVWLRPKLDVGLHENASLEYINFFAHSIYRNSKVRLIPLLEKWVPGCGPALIRKGYGMYDTTEGVSTAAAVDLLNTLVGHPRFDRANFDQYVKVFKSSAQADLDAASSNMSNTLARQNVDKALTRLRREFGPKKQ